MLQTLEINFPQIQNFHPVFPMDSTSTVAGGPITPAKAKPARSNSENVNPNVSNPVLKFSNSPSVIKSEKVAKKSAARNPSQLAAAVSPSPKNKIRQRKFVIAKRNLRDKDSDSSSAAAVVCGKCKKGIGRSKCLCVAYESLRASHEEFFKNRSEVEDEVFDKLQEFDGVAEKTEIGKEFEGKKESNDNVDAFVANDDDMGVKRSRDRLLEEARVTVPTPGSGRVMHLVKEFEKLSVLKLGDSDEKEVDKVKNDDNGSIRWESCGVQQPPKALETQDSSSSFCPSDFFLTSESLGLDSRRSYSLDSSQGSYSISVVTSVGGRKSRRSSMESSGDRARRHRKKKQLKTTSQKPFMLRTEERGRLKEEELMKKLRQMVEEEEKMRIPVAQGLPWTTDEPECLVKPPVKESTSPIDLVLHSDVRAVERSEFDHQVAVKMSVVEQWRTERERQQKLAEEEEIKRLRKELVPKAQPLPYFDRPFVPKRSVKQPTVPKEPKFHIPQHKKIKCQLSVEEEDLYIHQQ